MSDTPVSIDLTKPVTVLIEEISKAVGGWFRPQQILRVAEAEAKAAEIKAVSEVRIETFKQHVLDAMLSEESKKQVNMASITMKALPQVAASASPAKMEQDWISFFFDNCRLTSDEEMQSIWAKILAGEANQPGSISKRTVSLLSTIDKRDALAFSQMSRFCWNIGEKVPLIFDINNPFYLAHGIHAGQIRQLESIGLITFDGHTIYRRRKIPRKAIVNYQGRHLLVESKGDDNQIDIGQVLLTREGTEIAKLCEEKPITDLFEYVVGKWMANGHFLSEPIKT